VTKRARSPIPVAAPPAKKVAVSGSESEESEDEAARKRRKKEKKEKKKEKKKNKKHKKHKKHKHKKDKEGAAGSGSEKEGEGLEKELRVRALKSMKAAGPSRDDDDAMSD